MRNADSIISNGVFFISEYPLFYSNEQECAIWGEMKADIVYFDSNADKVIIMENKIGSAIGHGKDPKNSQFTRQLIYLMRNKKVNHIIL